MRLLGHTDTRAEWCSSGWACSTSPPSHVSRGRTQRFGQVMDSGVPRCLHSGMSLTQNPGEHTQFEDPDHSLMPASTPTRLTRADRVHHSVGQAVRFPGQPRRISDLPKNVNITKMLISSIYMNKLLPHPASLQIRVPWSWHRKSQVLPLLVQCLQTINITSSGSAKDVA